MPIDIKVPERRDPLDSIAKAVGIARNVYGIYSDSKLLDDTIARRTVDAKRQAEEDLLRGLQIKKEESQAKREGDLDETDVKKSPILQSINAQLEPKGIKLPPGISGRQALAIYDSYLKPKPEGAQKDPTAQMLAAMRLQDMRDQKSEKDMALQTPYGKARTIEDAKQLKDASETKASFDRKINELINLRKTYGIEFVNREAVDRGKQLSKALLLDYKTLKKLGVLSQADIDIVDAIIPADPLKFSKEKLFGQDSVLTRLEKFKEDSQADFENTLANRLRPGSGGAQSLPVNPAQPTGGEGLTAGPGMKGMPAQTKQGGYIYYLNPKTGNYE